MESQTRREWDSNTCFHVSKSRLSFVGWVVSDPALSSESSELGQNDPAYKRGGIECEHAQTLNGLNIVVRSNTTLGQTHYFVGQSDRLDRFAAVTGIYSRLRALNWSHNPLAAHTSLVSQTTSALNLSSRSAVTSSLRVFAPSPSPERW